MMMLVLVLVLATAGQTLFLFSPSFLPCGLAM